MHLTGMTVKGILPFTDPVKFEFDPRVNVFIGPNATGKTSVLREMHVPDEATMRVTANRQVLTAVHHKEGTNAEFQLEFSEDWPGQETDTIESLKEELDEPLRLVWERFHFWTRGREVPWIYVPAIRQHLPLSRDAERMHDLAAKLRGPDTLADVLSEDTRYVFDCSAVLRLNHAYHEGFRSRKYSAEEIMRFESAKHLAWKCSKDICREILRDGDLPDDYVHTLRSEGMSMPVAFYNMQIDEKWHASGRVFAGDLSAGTQETIMWIWYLAIKIGHFYDFRDDWETEPAVLLIDELENQLHPVWQRRVLPALLEYFPGLQIFATTHSPFVVAGLMKGQVHKMYKDEDGTIRSRVNDDDINGRTVEEILRDYMEVDDPTDAETADAAAALRWLRYQQPTAGTAEEWREQKIDQLESNAEATADELSALRWLRKQEEPTGLATIWWEEEMEKLRSVVSRDLEVGGAVAAQRELLLERLSDLMEYDEESDEEN